MNNNKTLAIFIGLIALLNYSSSAYSAPPEVCFQTKLDAEIYHIFGFDNPKVHGEKEDYIFSQNPSLTFGKLIEYGKHGPAKTKAITITIKEITVNGKSYMDASESKTPSGEKSYFWRGVNAEDFRSSSSKFLTTPTGTEQLFDLTVFDPVCDSHHTQQLKIRVQ